MTPLGAVAYNEYRYIQKLKTTDSIKEYWQLEDHERQMWEDIAYAVREEVGQQLVRSLIV